MMEIVVIVYWDKWTHQHHLVQKAKMMLFMSKHTVLQNVCNSAFFYLRNIRSIEKYLHEDSLHTLVHAFTTNTLDYCNILLYDASKERIAIQSMCTRNAALRLLMKVGKHSHITPILYELHWLLIQAQIKFKIILFTFKAVHNLVPSDINSLFTIKSKSSRCLQCNDGLYLEPSNGKMLKTFGAWSFQACSSTALMEQTSSWN